jgi:hypothetical protein
MRCFFTLSFHIPPLGLHRRLDRHLLDGTEELAGDRGVDPEAAKCEAPRQSQHLVWTLAAIDGLSQPPAGVTYRQVPPAAAAG